MFADISGFTALGEKLFQGATKSINVVDLLSDDKNSVKRMGAVNQAAERLQAELNALLSEMVTCAINHGGAFLALPTHGAPPRAPAPSTVNSPEMWGG